MGPLRPRGAGTGDPDTDADYPEPVPAATSGSHTLRSRMSIDATGASAPYMTKILGDLHSKVANNPALPGEAEKKPLSMVIHRDLVKQVSEGKHNQPFMAFGFPGNDDQTHWHLYRLDGLPEGQENSAYAGLSGQLAEATNSSVVDSTTAVEAHQLGRVFWHNGKHAKWVYAVCLY